ncbi:MAG TPA: hypothetical protein VK709_00820 [Candidatus Saccharimonadales bacterium]|jgi:hypothetical protein|nr:hypothetical protein [Candidatus Saccharimonadales bacterium]
MKRRLAFFGVNTGALVSLLCLALLPTTAQEAQEGKAAEAVATKAKSQPAAKGGPAPRTADGHVDLSGIWFPGTAGGFTFNPALRRQFDSKVTPEEAPSFLPWAAAKIKAMTSTDYELGRASVNCLPRGVPGMFLIDPYPIQLIQTPGLFIQLDELNNNWRVVHTDGRPHKSEPDPAFNGDEVGHWDGDTLIIDVIGIDERTWNNFTGWFHSDQEHVVERISRPSMNYLVYQVTIEDPKVLSKPWTSAPHVWTLGQEDLQEYFCTNNQDVEQYKALKSKEAPADK